MQRGAHATFPVSSRSGGSRKHPMAGGRERKQVISPSRYPRGALRVCLGRNRFPLVPHTPYQSQ